MKKGLLGLLLTCFLCVVDGYAQKHVSLDKLVAQVSEKYNVTISHSPILLKKAKVINAIPQGSLDEVLTAILKGTGFKHKKIKNLYYIYQVKEIKKPLVADTVRVQVDTKADTVHLPPISLPAYKTPPQREVARLAKRNHKWPRFTDVLSPHLVLKTNLVHNATGSVNLGIEFGLARQWSLDISTGLNIWTDNERHKFKHFIIQPEARYWFCQRLSGSFIGLHAHYGKFNVGGLPGMFSDNMQNNRYEGWLAGTGVGYGYHWLLSNHWSLEAEIGLGYTYLKYNKFPCIHCGSKIKASDRHFIGPTKAAVSLIYIVK